MGHGFKAAALYPALRLLVNNVPGWQIIGHHPPKTTRPHDIPQGVEDFPQRIFPLRSLLLHERKVRSTEGPFFIAHIRRITFSCGSHSQLKAGMYILCTDISSEKLSTGSKV